MAEQVRDQQGVLYSLGKELGAGGQGKVFEVGGHPRLVIKRFHDRLLQSEDCEPLKRKVAALQLKRLEQKLPQGAWPQFPVFTADQRWCGYAMRKVKGEPLVPQRFLNPVLLEKSTRRSAARRLPPSPSFSCGRPPFSRPRA